MTENGCFIDQKVYLCDVKRNVECEKEGCFCKGGSCVVTTNQEYAWHPEKSKFDISDLMDWSSDCGGY